MDQGPKKWWAEFLGTFTLCFVGQGAVCATRMMGVEGGGLVTIALAHGLALATMISALGPISGGHFNPAVTFGFVVTRRITLPMAAGYWVAQFAGAVRSIWLSSISRIWPRPSMVLMFQVKATRSRQ